MPNKIINTGILPKVYNGRSLIIHRASSEPVVRASDGTLYAALKTGHVLHNLQIYRSEDNGLSWENISDRVHNEPAEEGEEESIFSVESPSGGLNHNGSHVFLQLWEELGILFIYHASGPNVFDEYAIRVWSIDLNEDFILLDDSPTDLETNQDLEGFTVTHNDHESYIVYASLSKLVVSKFFPNNVQTLSPGGTNVGTYFNVLDAKATDDGYVDIVIVADATTEYQLHHRRYNSFSETFSAPVTIHVFTGTPNVADVNVARDGYGNLLALWGEPNLAGTTIDVKYSISTTNGASWTTAQTVPFSLGHSPFIDGPTGELSIRGDIIGGLSGFILTYTRNVNGAPKTLVRQVTTEDGATYTLQAEQQIATQVVPEDEEVAGGVFFKPPSAKLLDLSDPGNVRIAYQIGQGNSTTQADTVPVRIGQELLSESAYPNPLFVESGSYTIDSLAAQQLLVTVNILGSPSDNLDFYNLGITSSTTSNYLSAFERVGTDMLVLRYEPSYGSHMSDRSSYGSPEEHIVRVVLDPATYEAPLADQGSEDYTSFIERDTRKLYLPPDFHLERTFLLNRGNFLKRTVWTLWFDGNEYELSQVVPFFLKNSICYYSANAYVIGASNDPFSKRILPSET